MHITVARMMSPIGMVEVTATERGIRSISFSDSETELDADLLILRAAVMQLQEYFAGERKTFDALSLALEGTEFSKRVWDEAMRIPYGETRTYGALAEAMGETGAARAVGTALGRNPLAIIVPCHRILPVSGEVGEFAWGSHRKKWLLDHEKS